MAINIIHVPIVYNQWPILNLKGIVHPKNILLTLVISILYDVLSSTEHKR